MAEGKNNIQPSAINPPPLTQILSFTLQQDTPTIKLISVCAPPPLLSVLLQGQDKHPLLPSTVTAHVPLLSALLIQKGVPLRKPSEEPAPLPQLSALPLQQGVPPLQNLYVRDTSPPMLSI